MALGDPVGTFSGTIAEAPSGAVVTTEYKSPWVQIIDNGGLETQDAAAITDPDAEITNSTTHLLNTGGRGSTLYLRVKWDDGLGTITDPVLQVFARHAPDDNWMKLANSNSTPTLLSTIVLAATDISDGTDNWTDNVANDGEATFPLLGCNQVLVGVQTALAASSGDATLSTLEAKVV